MKAINTFKPPPLQKIRYAFPDDAPLVMKLLTDPMRKNFRIYDIEDVISLIENAILAIVQLNMEDKLVGCLALKDYPLIPSVHPGAWEEYVWTKYKVIELNARNTLFVHLLCWNNMYTRDIVDNMLKSVFMHDPYVQYIVQVKTLLKSPMLMPGQARSEASFRRVQSMERGMSGDQLPSLCIADRKEICPRLRIRRAVEEDNDDIVPIIDRHSKRLRQLYGDYYISELIARHPESDRVLLVCEHKELAVGIMVLNTQINYGSLEECFDLSPFAGLRHLESMDIHTLRSKMLDASGSFISENSVAPQHADSSLFYMENLPTVLGRDINNKSRVTWTYDEDEFKDIHPDVIKQAQSSQPRHSTSEARQYADMDVMELLEQDEEVEFDIVNIDPALLKITPIYSPLDDNYFKNIMDGRQKEIAMDEKINIPKGREKKRSTVSSIVKTPEQITRYSGAPNAFLLELFAMNPDYDERFGFDMLEVAFELFPDRDYCVVCLPSNHTSYPLLEHFTLVTPHCTRMRFVNEALYVAHINSVRGDLRVRTGEECDLTDLVEILENAPRKEALTELFETSLISSSLDSYVLLSQNQPVGVVVIGPLEDGSSIRTQYELEPEPRQAGTDCTLLAGVISPIMEPHSRWFMRDVLRQSRFRTLFWICQPIAKGDVSPNKNMMSLAERMLPVRARRTPPNISGNKSLDRLLKYTFTTPFSLWVLERPLTSMPKVFVNNSIVVIGASRAGLSFLENLMMGPAAKYLTFTNLTLVSEHGLPTVAESLRAADTCIPRRGRYTDRYLKSAPFCFYVDVMSAVMVKIDRKKKCIYLKGGGVKYYDELVIACGHQFQHPEYMKEALAIVREIRKGKPCDRMLMDNPKYQPDKVPSPPDMPENVMVINSLYQANLNLRKLLRMISEEKDALSHDNPVVVYGECLEAYCCMTALLELGLLPSELAFVEPFPPEDITAMRINCFNDELVDERVQASIARLGIRVVRKCRFVDWRMRGNRVVSLRLMAPLHCIQLPCFAVFYYGLKNIDINAFRAINESGLVYDGGLVVNPKFETNDPNIYGAGTCVTYSRRLYADNRLHRYYYSEEVGEALSQFFLRKFDPFVSAHPDFGDPSNLLPQFHNTLLSMTITNGYAGQVGKTNRRWQPVLKFEASIAQYAVLPGPLFYLCMKEPGPIIPMEVHMYLPRQGHTLITDKNNDYFRIQLNVLHCVNSVTCLSKKPFSAEIMSQLYGKHEAFFNKLLSRFQLNQIEDFYDFFTQPWMSAVYHETFSDLIDSINHQDVGMVLSIFDLMKTRITMVSETKSQLVDMPMSCCENPTCGYIERKPPKLGTFRSIQDKHISKTSPEMLLTTFYRADDIPSECGQSAEIRGQAAVVWEEVGGEPMVIEHIRKYLAKHNVTNPHYAIPRPGIYDTEDMED